MVHSFVSEHNLRKTVESAFISNLEKLDRSMTFCKYTQHFKQFGLIVNGTEKILNQSLFS